MNITMKYEGTKYNGALFVSVKQSFAELLARGRPALIEGF